MDAMDAMDTTDAKGCNGCPTTRGASSGEATNAKYREPRRHRGRKATLRMQKCFRRSIDGTSEPLESKERRSVFNSSKF